MLKNDKSDFETKYIISEFDYGYIEWIITAFKKFEFQNDKFLVLKGSKELNYLPYKIDIASFIE